jgi:GTP-binding protein EngB required for normal cell division
MPIIVGLLLFPPLYIAGGLYLNIKSKRSYEAALLHYDSMTLKNSGIIDDIGTLENGIRKKIENGGLKNDLKNDCLQTILLNRKIRDILSSEIFIGVVGRIKQGKSTFVKEMTGVDTNPTSHGKTRKMQLCRLNDSVKIIDYPDCEKANHRIQFILSRYILDHVFMVCEARVKEVDANKKLFDSIKNACEENFTIIVNKIDEVLCDYNDIDSQRKAIADTVSKFTEEFKRLKWNLIFKIINFILKKINICL